MALGDGVLLGVRLLPLVLLALAGSSVPASAQPFEALGTRALGMGGAFVAVADDATAPYWNPAGIATGALVAVGLEHGRVERGAGDPVRSFEPAARASATFLGLTIPSLGLSYYRLSSHAVDPLAPRAIVPADPGGGLPYGLSSLVTHHVAVTLAQTLVPGLHVATAVKFVRGSAGEDVAVSATGDPLGLTSELGRRGSSTVDFDIGVMASARRLRVGLTGRNLRAPTFDTPRGTALSLDRQWRAGAAFFPSDSLTVAVDADLVRAQLVDGDRRNVAAGVEGWLLRRRLAVRTGVRASTLGEARAVGAGGASWAVTSAMFVDGQVSRGARPADSSWTVSARFAF